MAFRNLLRAATVASVLVVGAVSGSSLCAAEQRASGSAGPDALLSASKKATDDMVVEGIWALRKGGGTILGRTLPKIAAPAATQLIGAGSAPDSFALDSGDTLMAVADRYFGKLEESGEVLEAVPLSYAGMRLARTVDRESVYLFGGDSQTGYRLYMFHAGGELEIVLRLEQPIVAVADSKDSIYVATPDAIYRIVQDRLALVLRAGEQEFDGPITSIAAAEDDSMLFFATERRVYAFRGFGGASIVNDSGGAIRTRGGRLVVLDAKRNLLYTLQPLSVLTQGAKQ